MCFSASIRVNRIVRIDSFYIRLQLSKIVYDISYYRRNIIFTYVHVIL